MKITNNLGLPRALVDAVLADEYSKGDADFSATELLKPPKLRTLHQIHADEITDDVSDRVWALLGKVAHRILDEHAPEHHITEQRIFKEITVNGVKYTVSGAMDIIDGATIQDWKVTSVGKILYGDDKDWTAQLNIYQWLVGKPMTLQIVPLLRDWKKGERERKKKYPPAPAYIHEIESWSLSRCEDFVVARIQDLVDHRMRDCTKEETWGGTRCKSWCAVAPMCEQGRAALFE